MDKPLVSIITPVYNCARYIDATISSVLGQDYRNIRYVVIDDASTDKPKYRPDSINFRVIRHKKNKGEQVRVNEGMKLVVGKYFMIVNADDPLLPGAVSTLVEFMEAHPDVLCAYPDYRVIDEEGGVRTHVTTREYDFKWMVRHHTWIPSVGSIFRSDLIRLIGYRDTSFRWLGDGDYWLRVGLAGKMAHVPYELACWRKRSGQASGTSDDRRAGEHIRVIKKFYQHLDAQYTMRRDTVSIFPFIYKYMVLDRVRSEAICWSYIVASVVAGSISAKLKYVAKAVAAYPRMLISMRFWGMFVGRALFILRAR